VSISFNCVVHGMLKSYNIAASYYVSVSGRRTGFERALSPQETKRSANVELPAVDHKANFPNWMASVSSPPLHKSEEI
jgi:hypothetical protein